MNGVLVINKERGWTSRDVCNKLQSVFHTKSVGHTGTLDPFAEGVLLVTINKANKISQFIEHYKKTYVATLKLGVSTSTGDLNGEKLEVKNIPQLSKEKIEEVLLKFKGKIKQVPPMTSAVHYQGRKLYEIAHEGVTVERDAREVEVFDIKLISFDKDTIVFECTVSKGTYIRVLGEDIAVELGTVGHLDRLLRTKVGDISLDRAVKVNEVTEETPLIREKNILTFYQQIKVDGITLKRVKDGMTLKFEEAKDDTILIIDSNDDTVAIYVKANNRGYYRCLRGLW